MSANKKVPSLEVTLKKNSIYFFLFLSLVAALSIFRFSHSPLIQFQILTLLAIAYLSWALLHHLWDKTLSFEVMVEYVLTALLAVIILYGILL